MVRNCMAEVVIGRNCYGSKCPCTSERACVIVNDVFGPSLFNNSKRVCCSNPLKPFHYYGYLRCTTDPKYTGFVDVLRETTLTISVTTGESISMESELVRMLSFSIAKISEISGLKIWVLIP